MSLAPRYWPLRLILSFCVRNGDRWTSIFPWGQLLRAKLRAVYPVYLKLWASRHPGLPHSHLQLEALTTFPHEAIRGEGWLQIAHIVIDTIVLVVHGSDCRARFTIDKVQMVIGRVKSHGLFQVKTGFERLAFFVLGNLSLVLMIVLRPLWIFDLSFISLSWVWLRYQSSTKRYTFTGRCVLIAIPQDIIDGVSGLQKDDGLLGWATVNRALIPAYETILRMNPAHRFFRRYPVSLVVAVEHVRDGHDINEDKRDDLHHVVSVRVPIEMCTDEESCLQTKLRYEGHEKD